MMTKNGSADRTKTTFQIFEEIDETLRKCNTYKQINPTSVNVYHSILGSGKWTGEFEGPEAINEQMYGSGTHQKLGSSTVTSLYVTINEVGAIHGLHALMDLDAGKFTISEYYNNKKDGFETEYTFEPNMPTQSSFISVTNKRYEDGTEVDATLIDPADYKDIYWLNCNDFPVCA